MKYSVEISTALVGGTHVLSSDNVNNWVDIIDDITTTPCVFSVEYNGVEYTGAISKSIDGTKLLVAFDSQDIVLPGGVCLEVSCAEEMIPVDCPNEHVDLVKETKLSVLDEDGCPIGFITFGDILAIIEDLIPDSLCDLLGVEEIPVGNLTASDKILTTSGGCTIKAVPTSDIVCP